VWLLPLPRPRRASSLPLLYNVHTSLQPRVKFLLPNFHIHSTTNPPTPTRKPSCSFFTRLSLGFIPIAGGTLLFYLISAISPVFLSSLENFKISYTALLYIRLARAILDDPGSPVHTPPYFITAVSVPPILSSRLNHSPSTFT
jgi:hypothetical protein